MIARLAVWALGVVMLAGIVHIVVVLGVPGRSVDDSWSALSKMGPPGTFVVLPRPTTGAPTLPGLDPAMAQATCRFELDAAPVRIRVSAPDVYWSLSLYDRQGLHVWGLDNRGSGQKAADVLVAGDVHVAQLRENPPEQLEDVVIVDWKGRQGIALFQIFRQQPSLDGEIRAALEAAECKATPLQ
jgi:uncharacterized membrane protein